MGNGRAAPRDFGGDGDAKLGFSCVRRADALFCREQLFRNYPFVQGLATAFGNSRKYLKAAFKYELSASAAEGSVFRKASSR